MKPITFWQRTVRIGTAIGLLSATLATVASASQVRYRVYRDAGPTRVYTRSHSSAGAVLGGFVGGLVLGAVLSNASHAHAQAEYVYQDPYTDQCYDSYDSYLDQCRYEPQPRVVRVIEVRTGRCVATRRYVSGRWSDAQWNGPDRYYSGNDYRRYCDNHDRTWERERGDDRCRYDDRYRNDDRYQDPRYQDDQGEDDDGR